MSTLSESQIKEIREYWDNESSLNNAIIKLLPGDEQRKASEAAIDVLVLDGKVSEHEVEEWKQHKYAARWGGEHANLWMRMLLDRSERVLEQWKDQIYDAVCVKFQYCKRRKDGAFQKEGLLLAIAVADSLLSASLMLPIPLTSVAVYIVKHHILDKWCRCG